MIDEPSRYGLLLWFLLFLFFLRVLGQVLVALFHARWLPNMEQWYSGVLAYRYLLPIQIAMIFVMAWMSHDLSQGTGFFSVQRPHLSAWLVAFSYIYAGSMVVRYAIRMKRRPDQRWLGGTIPIIFHCVLAAFLYTFAMYSIS